MDNLFQDIPSELPQELTEILLQRGGIRVERIVSQGQASPDGFWYDQEEHELVFVLRGSNSSTSCGNSSPAITFESPLTVGIVSNGRRRTNRPSGSPSSTTSLGFRRRCPPA